MKIAVTGATGFIGAALCNRLISEGYEVISLSRASGFDLFHTPPEAVPEFDVLVHLAAESFVPASYQRPADFYHVNVLGTVRMLELCRQQQARLVFMSSYVYGRPDYLPIDEAHPLRALNPYGETKIMGEAACRAWTRDFGLETIILRLFNVYGPGQDPQFLIPKMVEQATTGKICLQDPRPRRDFVYLDDVVELITRTFALPLPQKTETFNIGSGKSVSIQELLSEIKGHFPELDITFSGEQRANEVLDTVSDISKAKELLGWTPQYDITAGMAALLASQFSSKN